jgi:hypothetical protein
MAPSQVNARNADEVAKRLYPPVKRNDLKFKFNVGDTENKSIETDFCKGLHD